MRTKLTLIAIGPVLGLFIYWVDRTFAGQDPGAVVNAPESAGSTFKAPTVAPQPVEVRYSGPQEGWPPQIKDATNRAVVPWQELPERLSSAQENALRGAALRDPRVRRALGDRAAFIHINEIDRDKGDSRRTSAAEVQLIFFSHSHNVAVEVLMQGTAVQAVNLLTEAMPPEGQDEIREAVALARLDDRLGSRADGLIGDVLMAHPRPEEPGYGNRLLYVTFYRGGQDSPDYVALVDLTTRSVLSVERTTN